MIPLKPFSVKLNDDERARLKEMSQLLDCTDGKAIRDALDTIYQMIHGPETNLCPKIVEIARLALRRRQKHQIHEDHGSTSTTVHRPGNRRSLQRPK